MDVLPSAEGYYAVTSRAMASGGFGNALSQQRQAWSQSDGFGHPRLRRDLIGIVCPARIPAEIIVASAPGEPSLAQSSSNRRGGRHQAIWLVDGTRTPFLKFRGRPNSFSAADLAVSAGRQLFLRAPLDPDDVDEVIFGCAGPAASEANIARIIGLRLGCGSSIPAWSVQRNCGSGMQALDAAMSSIRQGRSDIVFCGGTEAMSRAPLMFDEAFVEWLADLRGAKNPLDRIRQALRFRPAYLRPVVALLRGLTDPTCGMSMGQTAENLAWQFGISREEMDAWALRSHERLARAQDESLLPELEPLHGADGHAHTADDGLRRGGSLEALARLQPVFERPFGKVTAGNSAQVTDGAATLVLASETAVERHGLPVLARIVDSEWAGLEPAIMGLGPVHATTPLLRRHRMNLSHIDYWELNEAFAAQVLACLAAWKDRNYCRAHLNLGKAWGEIDADRLNVDGGAISLGHPVGASGARIVLHLAHVLRREGARRGLATLCIGGGQGGAMLLENPEATA